MPYSFITYIQLRQQLAARLGDTTNQFWADAENKLYITEALRTFGLLSAFWRERGTLQTAANTVFYSLNTGLTSGSSQLILTYSVTDQNIIQRVQYALLESATSQSSWMGTEMFTFTEVANAVQNRLNQFRADTGIGVNRSVINVSSPPIGRQVLAQSTVDVRRVAWLEAAPQNYYTVLWREDERLLTAADQGWSINPATPEAYTVMAPPPLTLQLSPIPIANGQLELFTLDSVTLNPAVSATTLNIPDDLSPAITWGTLSDLLGKDGIARDPMRAQYCETMYQFYVKLARVLPVIVHAELNGVPLIPVTIQEMDSFNPYWQNIVASAGNPPQDLIIATHRNIAVSPVPDAIYSITLDVIRDTPTYINDGDQVQIGREHIDGILDYAEHLALFKVGGVEWNATQKQAQGFIQQVLTYNQRISAAARSSLAASEQSKRQSYQVPRRLESSKGLGTFGYQEEDAGARSKV